MVIGLWREKGRDGNASLNRVAGEGLRNRDNEKKYEGGQGTGDSAQSYEGSVARPSWGRHGGRKADGAVRVGAPGGGALRFLTVSSGLGRCLRE